MHRRLAFKHLHLLVVYPFLLAQCINSLQILDASGSSPHKGVQLLLSFVHPHWPGLYNWGCLLRQWPQQWTPWRTVLLTCWMNASDVGGNNSSVHDFLVKSCLCAVLRSVQSLVLSYMIMTNRSKTDIVASSMSSVTSLRFRNASVTTGHELQASQAVFCLYWQNLILCHIL